MRHHSDETCSYAYSQNDSEKDIHIGGQLSAQGKKEHGESQSCVYQHDLACVYLVAEYGIQMPGPENVTDEVSCKQRQGSDIGPQYRYVSQHEKP